MSLDGNVGRLVHGGHSWTVVLPGKAVNVDLKLHRSNCRVEVEQSFLFNPQPVGQVPGIGEGSGETHHSHFVLRVGGDEVGTRHNDFKDWTSLVAKKMDLIDNQHSHGLDVCPERVRETEYQRTPTCNTGQTCFASFY